MSVLLCDVTIPGQPVGQPRQRHTGRSFFNPKSGKWQVAVRNYTPKDHPVTAWKEAMRAQFLIKRPEGWQSDADSKKVVYFVSYFAAFQRPKSMSKHGGWEPHVAKPDIDNVMKAIHDAGEGFLWRSDARVFFGIQVKVYAPPLVKPFTRILAVPTLTTHPLLPERFSDIIGRTVQSLSTFRGPS